MNIVALLTGRGNNTLKDKNILPVLGKPLMQWPALEAKKCKLISHFFCSSDDENILKCAEECGYSRILRPKHLSLPKSQHIDVIKHAFDVMQNIKIYPDILIVLLCNNVTIKASWIEQSINDILNDNSITSVCPVEYDQDHHPYRAKTISRFLQPFFDFSNINVSTNRQDLSPCVFLCHNFWTLNVKKSLFNSNGQKPWVFLGDKIKPIFVSGCFDVHNTDDLKRSEAWLKENIIS